MPVGPASGKTIIAGRRHGDAAASATFAPRGRRRVQARQRWRRAGRSRVPPRARGIEVRDHHAGALVAAGEDLAPGIDDHGWPRSPPVLVAPALGRRHHVALVLDRARAQHLPVRARPVVQVKAAGSTIRSTSPMARKSSGSAGRSTPTARCARNGESNGRPCRPARWWPPRRSAPRPLEAEQVDLVVARHAPPPGSSKTRVLLRDTVVGLGDQRSGAADQPRRRGGGLAARKSCSGPAPSGSRMRTLAVSSLLMSGKYSGSAITPARRRGLDLGNQVRRGFRFAATSGRRPSGWRRCRTGAGKGGFGHVGALGRSAAAGGRPAGVGQEGHAAGCLAPGSVATPAQRPAALGDLGIGPRRSPVVVGEELLDRVASGTFWAR